MQVQDVEVAKIETNKSELSDKMFRICLFCDKVVSVHPGNFASCSNLSGTHFYCPFCLRSGHHYRSARNVLIMSFRSIIGYYYYRIYHEEGSKWLFYLNDLERYISDHVDAGLENPVFNYDPETFLWFIDFNRVGKDSYKAPFDEVLQTAEKIYRCFEAESYTSQFASTSMWNKFSTALTLYHEKRKRPKGKRKLIPTFSDVLNEKPEFWNLTRNFTRNSLNVK
jgi:hypothetical protein